MMDKRYLSPLELLRIATQHAYSAEKLLKNRNHLVADIHAFDDLMPVTTLIYKAFILTFKAYAIHEHRPIKQYRTLQELVDMNGHLGFSNQELILFKTLGRNQSFVKGISHDLWETPQQMQVFCEQLLDLYEHVQELMPIELQSDYHVA